MLADCSGPDAGALGNANATRRHSTPDRHPTPDRDPTPGPALNP